MSFLLAATALMSVPYLPPAEMSPSPRPNVVLSGIRLLKCNEGSGTGFVVDENVLATALHVATLTNCRDAQTGELLRLYHSDEKNDFALMAGTYSKILALRYGCSGYKTAQHYDSYGISSFAVGEHVFRQYKAVASDRYSDITFEVGNMKGGRVAMPGMRYLRGYVVPGNSGGPVTDSFTGIVQGINNVGTSSFFGLLQHNDLYSYELKNTVLCRKV